MSFKELIIIIVVMVVVGFLIGLKVGSDLERTRYCEHIPDRVTYAKCMKE